MQFLHLHFLHVNEYYCAYFCILLHIFCTFLSFLHFFSSNRVYLCVYLFSHCTKWPHVATIFKWIIFLGHLLQCTWHAYLYVLAAYINILFLSNMYISCISVPNFAFSSTMVCELPVKSMHASVCAYFNVNQSGWPCSGPLWFQLCVLQDPAVTGLIIVSSTIWLPALLLTAWAIPSALWVAPWGAAL